MASELSSRECVPCRKDTPPLKGDALMLLLEKLGNSWQIFNEHHLEKEFKFKNFKEALDFTNRVGALAEEVGHHPDFYLAWGKVKVNLWTHKINGLSETDFIFAAKADTLL